GDNYSKWLVSDSTAVDAAVVQELGYDPENPFSMLAHYVKMVAENYATMNYRVDSIGVLDGRVVFNDYTLQEPFRYELTDLMIRADDINSNAKELVVKASSTLNRDGTMDAELAMDPHSTKSLRIDYTLTGVGMPSFAPYTVHYVAHPILSGRTRYSNHTTIVNDQLDSRNELFIEDMQFGKKLDIQDAFDLPMRLVVSLLRDKDGNIDLKIPVSGDLSDPNYHLWPVIWQVVKNIFVKALSAPANMLARAFDADEDDLKAVRFLPLQDELTSKQTKPLDLLLRVLREKPELSIALVQCGDRRSEAEKYALDQAKVRYFVDSTGVALDSNKVDESLRAIDIRSPGFGAWLDAQLGPGSAPVQERCMALVGQEAADAAVARLWEGRRNVVEAYLREQEEGADVAIVVRDRNETDTLSMIGMPTFQVIYGADGQVDTRTERPTDP
ncbi:MAG: DUF748 domain-containing protein, partial [Flavobacteriales bacterium]|nr:DUF748 domain-containing protein [Flavobacteriales bacterium]